MDAFGSVEAAEWLKSISGETQGGGRHWTWKLEIRIFSEFSQSLW